MTVEDPVKRWRDEALRLRAELDATRSELAAAKTELAAARVELAAARAEIAVTADLRAQLDEARALLAEMSVVLTDVRAQNRALTEQVQRYEHELLELRKRVFGRTSERSPGSTPRSTGNGRAKNDAQAQKSREKNRERRKTLPVEQIDHPVAEEEHGQCPNCGEAVLQPMPADESVEYEYVPGRLVRRVHARETLRCPRCYHFVRAKAPTRVAEGSQYGPGFVARTVVQKCADCVPLYRQSKGYRREGLFVAPSTLVDLYHRAASLIEPIHRRLMQRVPQNRVVYADETTLKMQTVKKLGYVWTFATESEVVYTYSASRSGETPVEVLGDSEGVLVVDAYTGYNAVTMPGKRTRGGCNAHARRKFVDIDDDRARQVIDLYKEVFAVEREAELLEITGTPEHVDLRRSRSRPAMEAIKAVSDQHRGNCPPKSPLGQAFGYLENQWAPLTRFLDDVGISPHNNLSERLLRIVALGRKNYLFVGHEEAGQNTAMLCSIISTCVLHDVNPQEYLADVLIRVQDHPASAIDDLLPDRWKAQFGTGDGARSP